MKKISGPIPTMRNRINNSPNPSRYFPCTGGIDLKITCSAEMVKQGQQWKIREETDKVFAYAKGVGKEPSDVLDDPFVQNALESMKQKKAIDDATPKPSGSGVVVGGKNWANMSKKERKDNFSNAWGK